MSVSLRIWLAILMLIVLIAARPSWRRKVVGGVRDIINPSMGPQASLAPTGIEEPVAVEPEMVVPGIDRKMIEVGDRDIWYLEGGAGERRPEVLLLHGFTGDKEHWLTLMTALVRAGFHAVAPDLPGCGQNGKDPQGTYDVMSQAKRMRAFAHRIGLRSIHIVGSSMGGTIGAALAYAIPSATRSLTLIEPFGVRVPYETELDKLLTQGRNPMIIAAPAAYDNLAGFLYQQPPADRFRKERAERLGQDRLVNLKIWQDVREGERANVLDILLTELKMPTLVIQGANSNVVHPATADVIAGMMASAATAVIPHCGHFPMVEKPRETAAVLLPFLRPPTANT